MAIFGAWRNETNGSSSFRASDGGWYRVGSEPGWVKAEASAQRLLVAMVHGRKRNLDALSQRQGTIPDLPVDSDGFAPGDRIYLRSINNRRYTGGGLGSRGAPMWPAVPAFIDRVGGTRMGVGFILLAHDRPNELVKAVLTACRNRGPSHDDVAGDRALEIVQQAAPSTLSKPYVQDGRPIHITATTAQGYQRVDIRFMPESSHAMVTVALDAKIGTIHIPFDAVLRHLSPAVARSVREAQPERMEEVLGRDESVAQQIALAYEAIYRESASCRFGSRSAPEVVDRALFPRRVVAAANAAWDAALPGARTDAACDAAVAAFRFEITATERAAEAMQGAWREFARNGTSLDVYKSPVLKELAGKIGNSIERSMDAQAFRMTQRRLAEEGLSGADDAALVRSAMRQLVAWSINVYR